MFHVITTDQNVINDTEKKIKHLINFNKLVIIRYEIQVEKMKF